MLEILYNKNAKNLVGGDKDDKKVEDRDGGGPRADPEGDPDHVIRPPPSHHPHLRRQVALIAAYLFLSN